MTRATNTSMKRLTASLLLVLRKSLVSCLPSETASCLFSSSSSLPSSPASSSYHRAPGRVSGLTCGSGNLKETRTLTSQSSGLEATLDSTHREEEGEGEEEEEDASRTSAHIFAPRYALGSHRRRRRRRRRM